MIKCLRNTITVILSLCLIQAAFMLIFYSNAGAQTVFRDVGENDPLLPYSHFLHEKGIVSGFPDGTFRPADSLTRAQAAGMVVLAKGLQPIAGGQPSFSDVSPGHWAYGTVEAAVRDGLLQGYPDGSFGPENTITRAEAVTLLLNLSGGALSGQDVAVSDVAAGHWAYRQVATAVAAGLVELPAGNLFYPGQPLRRDELARGLTKVITLGPSLRANELTGKLRIIKGKVALTTPEEGLAGEISGETKVSAGAKISTFENSQAEITFDDGSGILIEANSEIIIKKSRGNAYMRNDGSPGVAVDRLELELTKGKMSGALASRYDLPEKSARKESPGAKAAESGYALLASREITPGLAGIILAQNDYWYGEYQYVPWWEEPFTERERVVVDMPWGVAGIRGTYWMINISSGSQSVSLIIGNAVVTAGGKTISITGDQYVEIPSAGGQPSSPAPLNAEQKEAWLALKDWVEARALDVGLNMPADIEPAISMTITQVEELPELPGIPVQEAPPEETAAFTAVIEAFTQATGEGDTSTPTATDNSGGNGGGGNSKTVVVHFNDANLEAAVRDALNKPAGDITSADMAGLTQLDASNQDIADLGGLEYAVNLLMLYLGNNMISDLDDLDALKGLVNLQHLALEGNRISDISALAGLTSLQILWLNNNQVSDLEPLSGLINLESLFLHGNLVSDLKALGDMTKLHYLDLHNNRVSDLEGLAGLTGLMTLNLSDNQVSALGKLSGLIKLEQLLLANNQVSDLEGLENMTKLQFLDLGNNQGNNQVKDLDPLAELINLQIILINNNLVRDLDALAGLIELKYINLAKNKITGLAPLVVNCQGGGLGQHDYVDISYNLLDLTPGSQAMDDIETLLNNNVYIVYEPTESPTVSSTDPADGITGIPLEKTVTVTFNKSVQEGNNFSLISLKDENGATVAANVCLDPANPANIIIDPVANLNNNVTYTIFIPAGAVKDLAGNILAEACTFSFTTVFNNDAVCIVLTWNQTPEELDAHINGYLEFYDEQFHVYYGNMDSGGVSLHIDDVDGYGPEIITISQLNPDITYRYWVHDFTNGGNKYSTALADSGAQVQVTINGQNDPITYNVPSMEGTIWLVFEISGASGQITPLNIITNYTTGIVWTVGYPPIHGMGETVDLQVIDEDMNKDPGVIETITVNVKSSSTDTTGISVALTESDISTGIFKGSVTIAEASDEGAGKIGASIGETVTITYIDAFDGDGLTNQIRTTVITVIEIDQIDVVHFNDANLEAAVRDALNKPAGDITSTDMAGLTDLYANNKGIADLTGLEYAVNLQDLYLRGNQISDITALAGLTGLQDLYLHENQISDITALSGLTGLQNLYLHYNQISDITALAGLTGLQDLYLHENQISDITALSGLTGLQNLYLSVNQISDITALATNNGLGAGDSVRLFNNPLDTTPGSQNILDIQALQARGVNVSY